VPDFELHHLLAAVFVEFERAVEGVRRLLVVIEHELSADGADLGRILHAQAPAGDIHLVDALIAQIAIAVSPIPVPVIVEAILFEGDHRRGTGPEVVVHPGGRLAYRLLSDRVAPLEAKPARHVHVADEAFPHFADPIAQGDAGAALAPLLYNPIVLARRRDN